MQLVHNGLQMLAVPHLKVDVHDGKIVLRAVTVHAVDKCVAGGQRKQLLGLLRHQQAENDCRNAVGIYVA